MFNSNSIIFKKKFEIFKYTEISYLENEKRAVFSKEKLLEDKFGSNIW